MKKQYTRDEAHEIVIAHLRQYKLHLGFSNKEIAEQVGVSPAYISQVLKGNFKAQGKIMRWAGLQKKVVYERVKP